MEAGKERLTRDTVRDATQREIQELKRANDEFTQLVAELSLQVHRLKKNVGPDAGGRRPYQRMSAGEKSAVLAKLVSSRLPKRQVLEEIGGPKSTYYRWLRRQRQLHRLEDRPGGGAAPWNRLTPREERAVLTATRATGLVGK